MSKILIVTNYWEYPWERPSTRFHLIAELLESAGHDVSVIGSTFNHSKKAFRTEDGREVELPYDVTLLGERGYPRNVSLQRVASQRVFARNLARHLETAPTPDLIYVALPTIEAGAAVRKFALRKGIPYIVDIQDLWPEVFYLLTGNGAAARAAFAPLRRAVDRVYADADEVVAVSATYARRGLSVNRKGAEGLVVFLGTRLAHFDEAVHDVTDPVADESVITLGFAGTLGISYDLPTVFGALDILEAEHPGRYRMRIMGRGPLQEQFEAQAAQCRAEVTFLGYLPHQEMACELVRNDINIDPLIKLSPASVINKHGDYLAAGRAAVSTHDSGEFAEILAEYGAGLSVPPEDPVALASAIEELASDRELLAQRGRNARRVAESFFDQERVYPQIVERVNRLLATRGADQGAPAREL